MKQIFQNHWPALVLAILAGLLMVVPQIFFMDRLGPEYKGIYMLGSDAETHYLSRMQEFYDGNGIGNAFYYEDKNNLPDVYFTISESLLAIPGVVLHVSASTLNLVYKFLLPILCFILVYILVAKLTGEKAIALAGASLVILGNMLFNIPDLLNLFSLHMAYSQFAMFARPVNPEFSALIFYGFLILLLLQLTMQKKWLLVAETILFVLSFYTYFFLWTFLLVLQGVVIIIFALKRADKSFVKNQLVVLISGIILGSRAIVELLAVKSHPFVQGVHEFYIQSSHMPVYSLAGLIVTLFFIIHLYKRGKSAWSLYDGFLGALLVSSWAVINQQVITGISLQSGHYHWYFNVPVYALILIYLFHIYFHDNKRIYYSIIALIIAVSFFASAWVQYSSYVNSFSYWRDMQKYMPVLTWLNKNAKKNEVVLTDKNMSDLVPIYTSLNVFDNGYARYYVLDPARRDYSADRALQDMKKGKNVPFRLDYIVAENGLTGMKNTNLLDTVGAYKIYGVKK